MSTIPTIPRHDFHRICCCALLAFVVACGADGGEAPPQGTGTDEVETSADDSSAMDAGEGHAGQDERCAVIQASIESAGFGAEVTVTCDDEYAYLTSETYPTHDLMNGIVGTNEQIPVPALDYTSPIRLDPVIADQATTRDAALGVAVNGVPIYDYSAAGEIEIDHYDPSVDTIVLGQLDNCGGHAGRGDDYHYHASPICMIDAMVNSGDDAILGWGFDGFPIYGDRNPDGSTISEGTLDACNGQPDEVFGFRYHTSPAPPYIVQCLVGEVETEDPEALPRVPPLSDSSGQPKPSGMPPSGGVDDLQHTLDGETRTMSYEYEGNDYYIRYTPSGDPNCYAFEFKTVTNGGVVQQGVYCR